MVGRLQRSVATTRIGGDGAQGIGFAVLARTCKLEATGEKTTPQSRTRGTRPRGANALPARAFVPPRDPAALSMLVVAYASPSSVFILRPTPKRSTAPTTRVKKMPASGMPFVRRGVCVPWVCLPSDVAYARPSGSFIVRLRLLKPSAIQTAPAVMPGSEMMPLSAPFLSPSA